MNLMPETPLFDAQTSHLPAPVPFSGAWDLPLDAILHRFGPIPRGAIFLGLATDGLPVLLNLRDPTPGPLLIVGDPGSGKRRLLQVMARSADLVDPSGFIRLAILTAHPSDWDAYGQSRNCEGILAFHHLLTSNYLGSLVHLRQTGVASKGYLLLLVDDMEAVASDPAIQEDMLWLLHNGPANSIWPIVAVSTPRTPALAPLLEPFHTVLCGRMAEAPDRASSKKGAQDGVCPLEGSPQFALLSGNDWLRFWVPQPI